LLEEVSHDVSMSGRDSGPHWAWDRVLQLHEGGDEQRVLLALDQDFSLQPEEREVLGTAPHPQPSRGRARTTPTGARFG
jgi:hypothetical protein